MALEFKPFDKIPRLKRAVVVTEKIDGTNAQVYITTGTEEEPLPGALEFYDKYCLDTWAAVGGPFYMFAGSRNRWIHPGDDNYGFAGWVKDNAVALRSLGEGQHFGEWWGRGIGRNYGLTERRFSLFNVHRWNSDNPNRPECCHVVPTLAHSETADVEFEVERLRTFGSVAAPGFMKPEGVVVYHTAARSYFKVTLEKDAEWKGDNRVKDAA